MISKSDIRKTLLEERKKHLGESFHYLEDIRDSEFRTVSFMKTMAQLLDEGYSEEEIINEITAQDVTKRLEDTDWKGMMGDAAMSAAKEYMIFFGLSTVLGVNKETSANISRFMADVNPMTFLRIFKGMSECQSGAPEIVDAIIEAFGRSLGADWVGGGGSRRTDYSLFSLTGMGASYAGNLFGEAIRDSNLGETIANKFCEVIH